MTDQATLNDAIQMLEALRDGTLVNADDPRALRSQLKRVRYCLDLLEAQVPAA